ncbi:hypothetical protein EJ05DRAFT_497048 [Pseudovirgaria hyperparasitica]|uniref:Uncharacterized protein n=1 Tax=Pseudovirgaria hyperparasitica TaxID=470096 RepID=A0A6A6WH98_9PEZI|nr:uncharacterized protein EJ05DRAFT_497048 [Pseudovirgaria hyperparasitica]KAF2762183.1 hypothetical protein EJ05DRAFT_497048 [Pseudovirgaria hyperparasitica]
MDKECECTNPPPQPPKNLLFFTTLPNRLLNTPSTPSTGDGVSGVSGAATTPEPEPEPATLGVLGSVCGHTTIPSRAPPSERTTAPLPLPLFSRVQRLARAFGSALLLFFLPSWASASGDKSRAYNRAWLSIAERKTGARPPVFGLAEAEPDAEPEAEEASFFFSALARAASTASSSAGGAGGGGGVVEGGGGGGGVEGGREGVVVDWEGGAGAEAGFEVEVVEEFGVDGVGEGDCWDGGHWWVGWWCGDG